MTHVREAVEQIRGTAVNQVEGAEVALVDRRTRRAAGERHAAGEERGVSGSERRACSRRSSRTAQRRRLDPPVLGRRGGGPPRRAALHQLRHVPAPAAAVLLRLPAPRGGVGRAARAPAPCTASPWCATRWRGCSTSRCRTPPAIIELDGTQGAGAPDDRQHHRLRRRDVADRRPGRDRVGARERRDGGARFRPIRRGAAMTAACHANDLEAINTLLANYCITMDRRDADGWANLFTSRRASSSPSAAASTGMTA